MHSAKHSVKQCACQTHSPPRTPWLLGDYVPQPSTPLPTLVLDRTRANRANRTGCRMMRPRRFGQVFTPVFTAPRGKKKVKTTLPQGCRKSPPVLPPFRSMGKFSVQSCSKSYCRSYCKSYCFGQRVSLTCRLPVRVTASLTAGVTVLGGDAHLTIDRTWGIVLRRFFFPQGCSAP